MGDEQCTLGLKVDVDTLVGYREGVPALLAQLDAAGVRASFFFAVGPDRSGVAIRRVFTQRGFVGKMLRNHAASTYGLRTLLYGTLLPAPLIVASDEGILRAVAEARHEVGVHGWDHIGWLDGVGRMRPERLRDHLDRAFDAIARITGESPRSFAAPGWQCSPQSLAHHDERGLTYASDVRGAGGPFLPRLAGRVYRTPQIPTCLPTLDEMWGLQVHDDLQAAHRWSGMLGPGVNVLTAHAEIEGMAMRRALPALLELAAERGAQVRTLAEVALASDRRSLPVRTIAPGRLRCSQAWARPTG